MEQDNRYLNRRSFVKLATATGLGVAVSEKIYAGEPREPGPTAVLQSSSLKVTLNSSTGIPSRYQLLGSKGELMGDNVASPIKVRVCRKNPSSQLALPARVRTSNQLNGNVTFVMHVTFGDIEAVEFHLNYSVEASRLTVSLAQILESNGFELFEVRLPALVTVRRTQQNAWMAHGDTGGALIEVATATPSQLSPNQFWGDTLSTLPVLMAGDSKTFCILLNAAYIEEFYWT